MRFESVPEGGVDGLVAKLARDELAEVVELTARVRLTRWGNRQLNDAVHRIAITQSRLDRARQGVPSEEKAEGMSNPKALRCLNRRLARIVYGHLHADQDAAAPSCSSGST